MSAATWETTSVTCDRCGRTQAFECQVYTYQFPDGWRYVGLHFHDRATPTEHLVICPECVQESDDDEPHVNISVVESTAPAARNVRWLEAGA